MEQKEFMSVVGVFRDKAFRLAHRLLISKQEAEDVLQDLYLKLWQRRGSLEKVENVEAFSMRMVKNACLDVLKSKRSVNVSLEQITEKGEVDSFEKKMILKSEYKSMKTIIDALPEQQRMVIQLRDIEQYHFESIAEILNISEGAVRVKLSRARKALKTQLLKK